MYSHDLYSNEGWIIVYLEDVIEESEGVYTLLLDFFTFTDYARFRSVMYEQLPEGSRNINWEGILNPESEKKSHFPTFFKIKNYKSSDSFVKDTHYYLDLYLLQKMAPKDNLGDIEGFPLLASIDLNERKSKYNAPLLYQTNTLVYPQWVFSSLVNVPSVADYDANSEIKLVVHNVWQGNMNEIKQGDDPYVTFDAGTDLLDKSVPFMSIQRALISELSKSSLPLFVLSHWHTDHYSLLFALDNVCLSKIQHFIFPSFVKSFGVYCFIAKLNLLGRPVAMQNLPFNVPWTKHELNAHINLYVNQYVKSSTNNSGLTLFVQGHSNNAMLPGDCRYRLAESQANDSINSPMGNNIHYLVIPHHGGLAGAVSYNIANAPYIEGIVSVGKNNRHGHPNTKVVNQASRFLVKPIKCTCYDAISPKIL